jgi:hypothetical protein
MGSQTIHKATNNNWLQKSSLSSMRSSKTKRQKRVKMKRRKSGRNCNKWLKSSAVFALEWLDMPRIIRGRVSWLHAEANQ